MESEAERVANKRADAKQSQKTKLIEKQPWIFIFPLKHQTQSRPHPPPIASSSLAAFNQKAQTCLSRQKEEVMIKIDLAMV
jgi:hypothetical protein